ncbi:hypothetical protein ACF3DV_04185 [Chlorogloeopsis fritschii PCC 9212]|nr:hypothetical protein [Chlorogloeopsis fritschii]
MSIPLVNQSTEEKLVTLSGVSWEQFKGIEAQLKAYLLSSSAASTQ